MQRSLSGTFIFEPSHFRRLNPDLRMGNPSKPESACIPTLLLGFYKPNYFHCRYRRWLDSGTVLTWWWRWCRQRCCRGCAGSWSSQRRWASGSSPGRTCWWRQCCRFPERWSAPPAERKNKRLEVRMKWLWIRCFWAKTCFYFNIIVPSRTFYRRQLQVHSWVWMNK